MLKPDDPFPSITLRVPGAGEHPLPAAFSGSWAYVLFYRGGW